MSTRTTFWVLTAVALIFALVITLASKPSALALGRLLYVIFLMTVKVDAFFCACWQGYEAIGAGWANKLEAITHIALTALSVAVFIFVGDLVFLEYGDYPGNRLSP